jgi:hypothetical protein
MTGHLAGSALSTYLCISKTLYVIANTLAALLAGAPSRAVLIWLVSAARRAAILPFSAETFRSLSNLFMNNR